MTALTRIDDMFPEFVRRFMLQAPPTGEPLGEIRLDVDETDKAYTVRAEIPGAKKDDIRVEIDGNRVAIAAEVRKDREEKDAKGRALVRETYRGRASRSFTLACDVDETGTTAKLEDGVLTLVLPKRAGARSRQIAIE
ncbi:MAG TPA: Hsp20 family protein [Methylibium sp.]|nr:Hsp20 family protein [Methylibium sp.]